MDSKNTPEPQPVAGVDLMSRHIVTPRKGDWMLTFTGRQFWPLDPRKEDVCLEDIAHALAHTCRFGGHCRTFYSVAQHSLNVANAGVSSGLLHGPLQMLLALLHDAAEAYVVDVPRPLKRDLVGYAVIEETVHNVIMDHFGLPRHIPAAVKDVDNRILVDERMHVMAPGGPPWNGFETLKPLGIAPELFAPQAPEEIAEVFTYSALQLIKAVRDELSEVRG